MSSSISKFLGIIDSIDGNSVYTTIQYSCFDGSLLPGEKVTLYKSNLKDRIPEYAYNRLCSGIKFGYFLGYHILEGKINFIDTLDFESFFNENFY